LIQFERITEEHLEKVLAIVNSNSDYNLLENGIAFRTIEEVSLEFLNETTESYFIYVHDQHVGVVDFLHKNPKDDSPWIGLIMLHSDYHSKGYGRRVYLEFEKKLVYENYKKVRLGVLQENEKAREYWLSLGFAFYKQGRWNEKTVDCYEKILT
jgi:RimJ/RimL family protein N-acetyltransferase